MPEPLQIKNSKHVLFLCKWFPYYNDPQLGIFAYKHAVAASNFCSVSTLYVRGSSKFSTLYSFDIKEDKVLTVNVYYKKSNFKALNFFRYIKAGLAGYQIIAKKNGRPTLLNFYILNRPALFGILISFFLKIPFIITEQWSGYGTGKFEKKNLPVKLFASFLIQKAKAIIVVSAALKSAMLKLNLKNQYFIIPNVIENVTIQNKEKDANKSLSLFMVADMVDEIKNISGVLKALHLLKKDGLEFTFNIIGGGPDLTKLQALAKEMNLMDKVCFYGRQTNEVVYKEMKEADVVIVNSNIETFSVICVEAMVNGKPVIATRCGGPEEIVTAKTGILIEKGNHEALKDAILQIKTRLHEFDPVIMNELALKKYSYGAVGSQLKEVFDFALLSGNIRLETAATK